MSNENQQTMPDETHEPKDAAVASTSGEPAVQEPQEENPFAQLQGDLERCRDLAMRTQADFENYRKRALREREEAVRYANSSFLERLIPVIDNFDFGLQAARAEGSQAVLICIGPRS